MSASWRDDDEEYKVGGARAGGGLRSKPRFSFTEVKMLLEAVKRNRYIILRKFNHGVSAETKKQTWAEITEQINSLGENHREVRQIMKKWADLKCDGKRRIVALRGPNGNNMRKKNLGPVERMVHKILMMSPRGDGDSDLEFGDDDDFSKLYGKGPSSPPPSYSYLSLTDGSYSLPGGASLDMSPLSSPEKDLGGDPFHSSSDFDLDQTEDGDHTMDFDENDDSLFSSYPPSAPPPPPSSTSLDPLPNDGPLRMKPVHTYSRNSQNHSTHPPNSTTPPKPPPGSSSSGLPPASDASSSSSSSAAAPPPPPPPPRPPTSPDKTASSAPPPPPASTSKPATDIDSTSQPAPSSSSSSPPAAPPASSAAASSSATVPTATAAHSQRPPPAPVPASGSNPSDPLPPGASSRRTPDHVAQMAAQSLQQQRAGRLLLSSVSQSLEVLAQSVQLLVESQQEFVQESLQLQRETVEVLRDFSNTALAMLRDKSAAAHQQPAPRY